MWKYSSTSSDGRTQVAWFFARYKQSFTCQLWRSLWNWSCFSPWKARGFGTSQPQSISKMFCSTNYSTNESTQLHESREPIRRNLLFLPYLRFTIKKDQFDSWDQTLVFILLDWLNTRCLLGWLVGWMANYLHMWMAVQLQIKCLLSLSWHGASVKLYFRLSGPNPWTPC